uniref:ODAD1 central coiled coil region domain-containing protein n=1 Tax=Lepisosteus oculatus TaxID=7918 RepID=W5MKN0_LEPOC
MCCKHTHFLFFYIEESSKKPTAGTRSTSNNNDSDNEGENELITLQRHYHKLEVQKKAEEKEFCYTIRKQRELLQKLNKEREEILINLVGSHGQIKVSKEHKVAIAIKSLLEKSEDVDDKIKNENEKLRDLDIEINEVQKKLQKDRTGFALKEDSSRKIQRLTNQLAQANKRFCSVLSSNSKLRQEIQTMQGEKENFQKLYDKLLHELQETRKKADVILEKGNEFHHTREEVQAKIIRIYDQQEKDTELYNAEMREIQRELNHVHKVEAFLQEKTKERRHDQEFLKAMEKRVAEAKEREQTIELKVTLNKYEEAIEKINEIIEKTNFDAELFFNIYMEREDLNFALFNYVTEQTSEIEDIREQIEQLKLNIELQRDRDCAVSQERMNIMKVLEMTLKDAVEASSKFKTDVGKYKKILENQLKKTGVLELATKIGVNTATFANSLGWRDDTGTQNILPCLGEIEQRVSELLAVWSYQKYQDAEGTDERTKSVLTFLGIIAPPIPPDYELQIPSTRLLLDSDEEINEEELKPLSKEELQQKIQIKEDGLKNKQGKTLP